MQVSRSLLAASAALLSLLGLASSSTAQTLAVPAARPLEPVPVQIHGLGAGTMILPGEGLGSLRGLLVQESSESALLLEAQLVPYLFLAEHTPGGVLSGGVYIPVDVESTDEPELIARVEGEWWVDEHGVGTLAAYFLRDDASTAGGSRIVGAVQGGFRVNIPAGPVVYAPPLTLPPPIHIPASAISVSPTSAATGISLLTGQGATAPLTTPAPIVANVVHTGEARSAALSPVPPTLIVDPILPSITARIRLRWVLEM